MDPEGRWLLERMQQTSERVMPLLTARPEVAVAVPHAKLQRGLFRSTSQRLALSKGEGQQQYLYSRHKILAEGLLIAPRLFPTRQDGFTVAAESTGQCDTSKDRAPA